MRIAIIGRTEILYDTAVRLHEEGHKIVFIMTAKEAPEYTRSSKDFQDLANKFNAPFAQGPKITNHRNIIQQQKPDIGISKNYVGVIPQPIIDIFPLGILNAHGGDLPKYRGNACQAWAILNGEKRVGLCIHKMIGGELDSGDIIARDYYNVNNYTKIAEIWKWMSLRIPNLFIEAVDKLNDHPNYILEKQSNDPKDALRCYPRLPDDGKIDWKQPSVNILRLINASNKPYPGAFCFYEGNKMIMWDAELVEDYEFFCAVPGQVTKINSDSFEVACGSGKLRIKNIEYSYQNVTPNTVIKSIRTRLI